MGDKNDQRTIGEAVFYWMAELDEKAKYTAKRILKSGNRMIVFWKDGTKTVVKRAEDEEDNDYAAFTAALACKLYGSNSAVKRTIKQKLEYQKKRGE